MCGDVDEGKARLKKRGSKGFSSAPVKGLEGAEGIIRFFRAAKVGEGFAGPRQRCFTGTRMLWVRCRDKNPSKGSQPEEGEKRWRIGLTMPDCPHR